jgi:beta-mannosidase
VEGPERVLKFLASHLPVAAKWDDYIYLTQLNQGLALKTCIEHWRANNRTNGSIIWQINDCWPVTSWALIDSELKPKLAYHFVKNIFSPQLVFFTKNKNELVVNLLNKSSENFSGQLKVYFIDAPSGKIVKQLSKKIEASTDGNIIAESFSYDKLKLNKNVIALSYLYSKHKELINTNFYKEQPWKYINTAGAKINIKVIKEGKLLITSDKPVLFVDLYCQGIDFSDRGFSIIPGEEKIVEFSCRNMADLKINDIQIFSLNNYLKQ